MTESYYLGYFDDEKESQMREESLSEEYAELHNKKRKSKKDRKRMKQILGSLKQLSKMSLARTESMLALAACWKK